MINNATLPILLKQLRLGTIRTSWEEVAQQAEKHHWTYPQYLTALCLEYLIQIIESLEREVLTLFDKSPDRHKKIFSQLFDGIKVSINKRRDQSVV